MDTLGMHTVASVSMAFLRPLALNIVSPRDGYDSGTKPGILFFGIPWFLKYAGLLVFAHHFILFYTEVFHFGSFFITFVRVVFKFNHYPVAIDT
ncbi:MAG: hypothetical protein HC906_04865 [Bacteroidales bacterium]|nr:hypothetical protein [Bacteroidales bacterium]